MKKILYILLFISFNCSLFSQNFMREAGVRGGITSGFTYRQYLDEYLSYESILSFRQAGMQLTLIRQIHEGPSVLDIDANFNFLYGFGAHVGFFFTDKYTPLGYRDLYYPSRKFAPVLGVDAYAGMEYRMESFPVVFGIDYKPFFEFSLYEYFRMRLFDFALTAKYRF
jgi:hypothetical protein